ncbi:MAG: LPXTG cell wall anchor domain-containing protein [Thaumarchaeota archaeon]|nr:LPXTG cell wall anchor domain-containing protein [Nitrososphaerota archaeon]
MDKRVFLLGVSMLAIGGASWFYFNSITPTATSGMTEDQTTEFEQAEVMNTGMQNISGMVAGIGFFIALISVGLRRRKKGEAGKSITQKPAQT